MKLPAGPILALLERTAVEQGYLGRAPSLDGAGEQLPGLDAFCGVLFGFADGYLAGVRKRGFVSVELADRIAVGLGLHPILIWPGEWPVDAPDDDEEADRQAREVQAKRDYMRAYAQGQRRSRTRSSHCGKDGHRPKKQDGHCPDCLADGRRDRYRLSQGIPLDAPVTRGRKRSVA